MFVFFIMFFFTFVRFSFYVSDIFVVFMCSKCVCFKLRLAVVVSQEGATVAQT